MKRRSDLIYFEGRFSGLFRKKNQRNAGLINYHDIKWDYLFITNPVKTDLQEIERLHAGDYWFKEKIRDKKWYRFLLNTTEILITKEGDNAIPGDVFHYHGDLHDAVIRDFDTDPVKGLPKIKKVSQDHYEMSGTIYFGIPKTLPKPSPTGQKSVANPIARTLGDGLNIFRPSRLFARNKNLTPNNSTNDNLIEEPAAAQPRKRGGCLSAFGNGFTFLYWLGALYYLWHSMPWLFWIILGAGILWLLSKLLGISCLKNGLSLLLIGFLVYYWMTNYKTVKQQIKPEDQGQGTIKILPPKEDTENQNSNEKDYLTEKQISWWDFIKNNYNISYNTSSLKFLDIQKHNAGVGQFQGQNEVELYTRVYNHMVTYDNKYIDSVVLKLKQRAAEKKLNKIQQAEMVTTLIQEIPYCLVHDRSCKEVVQQSGGGFIEEYHEDGGPCLPNIPAGLQSPYQFLHNLKGDCDTRSVLAHLLLTRLGIGSSVWISTKYGHSILGVALPVGAGSYKTIRGVKHYAVELTAKGFRLGMIAPEQRNMNNWDITLYKQ